MGLWHLILALLLAGVAAAQPVPGGAGPGGPLSTPINLIPVASCMAISAGQTLYMAPGTCVEVSEGDVALPLAAPAVFQRLACTTSTATGAGKNVTVTLRAGACGSLISTSFTCTITGGATPGICDTSLDVVTIARRQCFSLQVATPAGSPNVRVNCTLEKKT